MRSMIMTQQSSEVIMYCVKKKVFLDSVQYQIFEKQGRREVEDDLLEHSYLYEKTNKGKKKLKSNPFNDEKLEWMTEIKESDAGDDSIRISRSRTIKKIYDIGRSNSWEWFFTFTFNPDKVNSFNYADTSKKLSNWFIYIKRKCPNMKYLVVPEQHKSGRWHFHGLFSNVSELDFVESGLNTENGQTIFNVGDYGLGWSTAIKLDGSSAVVSYMTKYITKSLCEITKGKKRYWASRNCDLPVVEVYEMPMRYDEIIDQFNLDGSRIVTKEGYVKVTYIDQSIPQTRQSL